MTSDDPTRVRNDAVAPSRRVSAFVRGAIGAAAIVAVGGAIGLNATSQRAAAVKPPATAPGTTRAVAIGDSIMDGHGLDSESQAWPERVASDEHWTLTDLAQDGAGFVQKGNADTIFADQVREAIKLKPAIVIVSGSSNDLGIPETQVQAAIDAAIAKLRRGLPHAELLTTTPVWNETTSPPQLDQIDDAMREAVGDVGGTYLDIGYPLLGHPEDMQSDDVHPNARGQAVIADAVEAALRSARRN
jgi:acyl-CoA thioesterase-1